MSALERQRVVPYSARQMYQLVSDVPAYADFLPWCQQSRILERQGNTLVARLDLAVGAVRFPLTTRNHNAPDHSISMQLVEGPFRRLSGCWEFRDLASRPGSEVRLRMDFEFRSAWARLVLDAPFHALTQTLMGCFIRRARVLYGPES